MFLLFYITIFSCLYCDHRLLYHSKVNQCVHFIQLDKPIWSATYTDLLKRDLFKGYDKFARPAEPNATTNCTLGFTIRHIEINEQRSIMTLFGWVRMVSQRKQNI